MPTPDFCCSCDKYIDRTEALDYDEIGRTILCEWCITDAQIEEREKNDDD